MIFFYLGYERQMAPWKKDIQLNLDRPGKPAPGRRGASQASNITGQMLGS